VKYLVCFAVKEEAQFYQPTRETEVLITGMGSKNARESIKNHFQRKLPAHVISAGFAGGLDPTLQVGAIVYSSQDRDIAKVLQNQGARGGNFLSAETVAITAGQKKQLRLKSGADAVEMESHTIAEVCREANVPCTIIRVISDSVHENLPVDFNNLMTRNMRINFAKLALRIAASPALIGKLLTFRKQTIFAAQQLGIVLSKATDSSS
jgi:adenosylhomocysteine nucleosidase